MVICPSPSIKLKIVILSEDVKYVREKDFSNNDKIHFKNELNVHTKNMSTLFFENGTTCDFLESNIRMFCRAITIG